MAETPEKAEPKPAAPVAAAPGAPAAPAKPMPAPAAAPAAPPKPAPAPRPKTSTPEIQALTAGFPGKVEHLEDTDPSIPTILLDRTLLVEAMRRLKFEFQFEHLACITAVDTKDQFEVIYNLWSYSKNRPLEIKVRLPRADAKIPSLTGLWIGANWLEREEWDLMGIRFEGHPDLRRMFLPESWQGHPLRKDYDLKREQYVSLADDGTDVVYQEPREGAW